MSRSRFIAWGIKGLCYLIMAHLLSSCEAYLGLENKILRSIIPVETIAIFLTFLLFDFVNSLFHKRTGFFRSHKNNSNVPNLNCTKPLMELDEGNHKQPLEEFLEKSALLEEQPKDLKLQEFTDTWEITPAVDLAKWTTYTKVWIIGKFKVGKSTILNKLGVENARGSPIEHTLGELFLPDDKNQIVYVDTEGFELALGSDEPELRMNLVLNHARKCADFIVIVFPMLSLSDKRLFSKVVRLLSNGLFQLIIVHNLRDLKNEQEFLIYKKRILYFFKKKCGFSPVVLPNGVVGINYKHRSIINYFLGSFEATSLKNDKMIELLKTRFVGVNQQKDLSQGWMEALKETYFYMYNIFQDELYTEKKSISTYEIRGKTMGKKMITYTPDSIFASEVNFNWLDPHGEGEEYYMPLLLDPSKIEVDSIKFNITDPQAIVMEYTRLKFNGPGDISRLENQKEVLNTEWNVRTFRSALPLAKMNPRQTNTNEILVEFELAYSPALQEYVQKNQIAAQVVIPAPKNEKPENKQN